MEWGDPTPQRTAMIGSLPEAFGIGNVPNKVRKPDRKDAGRHLHDTVNAPNPPPHAASPSLPRDT